MRWYYRVGFTIVISGLVYIGWWYVAALYCFWLLYYVTPYELIVLGFLFDAYYGAHTSFAWYTVTGFLFCCIAIYLKPLIRLQIMSEDRMRIS